ncbi:uncharacterized protein N7483_000130 [Penicillium malachiteum]|uniref:uncharacterized protein n=1 Tax=Penicillium malachiteum TaxID=1324776 RepID=UPI00254809B3|nr:uncharacterized protein N7483_000130 [Penicillium malachiteum]KAJ5735005.1 hypothetical protein N7483_000130 [Penicillium malachiteum]
MIDTNNLTAGPSNAYTCHRITERLLPLGGKLCFWDLKTATLRHKATYEHLRRVFFSPDSKTFVNSTDGQDAVQDLSSGWVIFEVGDSFGSGYEFSKNGKMLARTVAGAGSLVNIWGIDSQKLLHTLEVHVDDPMCLETVTRLSFSPSGRFLAAAIRKIRRIVVGSEEVPPESDECVTESSNLHISIWEVETGELHMTLSVLDWNLESTYMEKRNEKTVWRTH